VAFLRQVQVKKLRLPWLSGSKRLGGLPGSIVNPQKEIKCSIANAFKACHCERSDCKTYPKGKQSAGEAIASSLAAVRNRAEIKIDQRASDCRPVQDREFWGAERQLAQSSSFSRATRAGNSGTGFFAYFDDFT